jgi:hypothetical protein
MKNVILGISGLLLLAMQVNAQYPTSPKPITNSKRTSTYTSSVVVNGATGVNAPNSVGINGELNVPVTVTTISEVNEVKGGKRTKNSYEWSSQDEQTDDSMKAKSFSKSFSIDKNDKLNLTNQFGSITIKTWAKNEIKVDADIKAYAGTDSEAQNLLDQTEISAGKDGDVVNFKTKFSQESGNWGNGSRNGKRWRREIKVNLTVYMPATTSLTASQKHGNITMDDFSGPTAIKVEFGNLIAGNLTNSNNYISVKYGKTTLQEVNQATIKLEFGDGITLSEIGTLDLDAQYARVTIGTIKGNATIKQRFGNGLTIASLHALELDAQYVNVKLGQLKGGANIKVQFNKLAIEEIGVSCKNLDLNAQYTTVNLGFSPGYNADFEVATSHTGFNYGSNVTAKLQGSDDDRRYSFSKNYTGQVGKGGTANVNVKSSFGAISFNRD